MTMLTEQAVRDRLAQVRETLANLDRQREVLLDMLRADERWLTLNASNGEPLPLGIEPPNVVPPRSKGGPSLMSAIARILYEAHGTPMHVKELWKRAQAMNAVTRADSPLSATDVSCYNLSQRHMVKKLPLERIGGSATFRPPQ